MSRRRRGRFTVQYQPTGAARATQGVIVMRFKEEGDQVISLALADREETADTQQPQEPEGEELPTQEAEMDETADTQEETKSEEE